MLMFNFRGICLGVDGNNYNNLEAFNASHLKIEDAKS